MKAEYLIFNLVVLVPPLLLYHDDPEVRHRTLEVLSEIGRSIAPAFSPMGMSEENWPAAVGIFTGVLAKEAVVGTLDALYGELAKSDAAAAGVDVVQPLD